MTSTKSKSDQLLKQSLLVAEHFTFSSEEFYDRVEAEIKQRRLPGITISRVEHAEGGLLSEKRVYLRLLRERFMFDTCAAPFGTDFFFASRCLYSPAQIRLWHLIVIFAVFALIYWPLHRWLGFTYANISVLVILLALTKVYEEAVRNEISDLDRFLLNLPAFGTVYEVIFRSDTYYREDTRNIYLETIPRIVQGIVDDITGKDGIKLHRYERSPVLGELFNLVKPSK